MLSVNVISYANYVISYANYVISYVISYANYVISYANYGFDGHINKRIKDKFSSLSSCYLFLHDTCIPVNNDS